MRDGNTPSPHESGLFRVLAKLRMDQTDLNNFAKWDADIDTLVAKAKKSKSLAEAISACEQLAEYLKELYRARGPFNVYEDAIEHHAYRSILRVHDIPLKELEAVKAMLDRHVIETLVSEKEHP